MKEPDRSSEDRRDFITKCGRFALVTPPVMALMLSASDRSYALAFSGGAQKDKKDKKDKKYKKDKK